MKKLVLSSLAALPIAAVGLFANVGSAEAAALRFGVDNGSGGINWLTSVSDGGVGDANSTAGAVTFIGSVGNFIVNVTTGISKPILGDANAPHLDLNSVNVSGAAGNLYIEFSDNNFTGPIGDAIFKTLIGGTTNGVVTAKTFLDNSNTLFGRTTELANLGAFTPGAFSTEVASAANTTSPFALTSFVKIAHSGPAQASSFDLELKGEAAAKTPEPSIMLGLGAAAIVPFLRRKKATSEEA